jgi:hypothetical protein
VTTVVYDDVYTVAERSCCDDLGIVTLIYLVDIASSIVTVFLDEVRRSRRILDEGYGQLIEC